MQAGNHINQLVSYISPSKAWGKSIISTIRNKQYTKDKSHFYIGGIANAVPPLVISCLCSIIRIMT